MLSYITFFVVVVVVVITTVCACSPSIFHLVINYFNPYPFWGEVDESG